MFNFKITRKIGYYIVCLCCLALLFPLSSLVVDRMVERSLKDKTQHIVNLIQTTLSLEDLVETLEKQPPLVHRLTVFKTGGVLVYDSARARFGPMVSPSMYMARHPEVPKAFEYGYGTGQFFSETLKQVLVHLAIRVDNFHGDTLVIRTAFPSTEVLALTKSFRYMFLGIGGGLLVLFGIITLLFKEPHIERLKGIPTRLSYRIRAVGEASIDEFSFSKEYEHYRNSTRLADLKNEIASHMRALRQERKERKIVFSHITEGIIMTAEGKQVVCTNQAAANILGTDESVNHENLHPQLQTGIIACLESNKPQRCRIPHQTKVNKEHKVIILPREHEKGVIVILYDLATHQCTNSSENGHQLPQSLIEAAASFGASPQLSKCG